MSELERPGVEGKVVTGGVAQSVTRENGVVHVRLTALRGPMPAGWRPGLLPSSVEFPEPVTVEAGEWITVEMEWLPQPARSEAAKPILCRHPMTATKVLTGPSAQVGAMQAGAIAGEVVAGE